MNKSPPFQESAYFVHQRYEDTAHVVFQQLQKKKKDFAEAKPTQPDDASAGVEVTHYGNVGVIARKEAAERFAAYRKAEKEKRKAEKKAEKSSKNKDTTPKKGAKGFKEPAVTEKYTPLSSPGQTHLGFHSDHSPYSLGEASVSSDNSTPFQSPRSAQLSFRTELKFKEVPSPNERQQTPKETPNSPVVTVKSSRETLKSPKRTLSSPKDSSDSSRETSPKETLNSHKETLRASPSKPRETQNHPVETLNSTRVTLNNPKGLNSPIDSLNSPRDSLNSTKETFNSSGEALSSFRSVETASNPQENSFGIEEESLPYSPKDVSFTSEQEFVPLSPNGKDLSSEEDKSQVLDDSDSVVDFGHYGNTGVVATKEAASRVTSVTRKEGRAVQSKVCQIM